MKLRNNKGYVMTDASIAIIIALILIPTIMGLVYSIRNTKRASETKTGALNIATNALETAKGTELEELDESEILDSLKSDIYKEKMTIDGTTHTGTIKTDIATYQILINVVDYKDDKQEDDDILENIVKTITASVKFRLNGKDEEISLSTVVK